MNPTLRLRHGHPLHPVHATFVLQPLPYPLVGGAGPNCDGHRFVSAEVGLFVVEHLGDPILPLRVSQVHPQQVAGEQRRLVTTLTRLDLEQDVLQVVRVLGN